MTNKKLPWVLVLASMALLILFVSYWVVYSYQNEKSQLKEDIKTQLQLSYSEVKNLDVEDRLTYFFATTSNDSLKSDSIKIQINDLQLSNEPPSKNRFPEWIKNNDKKDNKEAFGFNYLLNKDTADLKFPLLKNKGLVENDTISNVLVHVFSDNDNSFRIIQDHSGLPKWSKNDSIVKEKPSEFLRFEDLHKDDFNPDFLLKQVLKDSRSRKDKTYSLFAKKLEDNDLPRNFLVVDEGRKETDGLRVRYTSNSFGLMDWTVDMQDVAPYLLKKILPIILFSLFLLGIVGLAFWILMNNYIKQQRLVKIKSEFINNMTHELKTPLSTMAVALEAVSGFDLNRDAQMTKEYIDISRHEVSRLSLLVDKVLNIAVFDREDSAIKMGKVDMNEVVTNILNSMKIQFDNRNAEVQFLNTSKEYLVKGDTIHLTNVIYNIVDNALKYSKEEPEIDIKIEDQNKHIKISVQDNGIGIPKEYADKVFDRFFRVPKNDQHDVKGHGLGLSYVKDVLHRHGGDINVKSVDGGGTKFTITLPKFSTNA